MSFVLLGDIPPQPSLSDFRAAVPFRDCNLTDTACVMANNEAQTNAYEAYRLARNEWLQTYGSQYNPRDDEQAESSAPPPAPSPAAPPAPAPVVMRAGNLRFENLTSGNTAVLRPGDHWTVSIAGASPNLQVSVKGGKDGAQDLTPMGQTDSAGNFTRSGVIGAGDVGSWYEQWFVSNLAAGSFSFRVDAAPPAPAAPAPAGNFQVPTPVDPNSATTTGILAQLTAWVKNNPVIAAAIAGGAIWMVKR